MSKFITIICANEIEEQKLTALRLHVSFEPSLPRSTLYTHYIDDSLMNIASPAQAWKTNLY